MIDKISGLCYYLDSKSERKTMAETYTPVLDPGELSPEEIDALREQREMVNTVLEGYVAHEADNPDARRHATELLVRTAAENPTAFLATRELLSESTMDEDPTEEQLKKEEVLKDVLDGPIRARTITKEGVFAPPTPEVRARVERAIEAVRDAESTEGKTARRISDMNARAQLENAYHTKKAELSALYKARRPSQELIDAKIDEMRHLSRGLDIQSGNTEYSQEALDGAEDTVAYYREQMDTADTDEEYDRAKHLLAQAETNYAKAQEDLEKVRERVGNKLPDARTRLRNLLDEHPEGIDVVHEQESTHLKHGESQKTLDDLAKKEAALEKAREHTRELRSRLDPGDGRIALAEIAEYKAQDAYHTAQRHNTVDLSNAQLRTELADENALDKRVREEQAKAVGDLNVITAETVDALGEWQNDRNAKNEHGVFVGINKLETYMSLLDEKIALADPSDRRLPHYRAARDDAFDTYLQLQYHKETVRTIVFADQQDFEGRHSLAHMADLDGISRDKGIVLARSNGNFVIYPDRTYVSVDEDGTMSPRVDAYGAKATAPVLEPIADPKALVGDATIEAWKKLSNDQLANEDARALANWYDNPADASARAESEVLAGLIRERYKDSHEAYYMEATYFEQYLAVGREGNPAKLHPDGSVEVAMTLYGEDGQWVIHPNGFADLYNGDPSDPANLVNSYNYDGHVMVADTIPEEIARLKAEEAEEAAAAASSAPEPGSGESGLDDGSDPDAPAPSAGPTVSPDTAFPTPEEEPEDYSFIPSSSPFVSAMSGSRGAAPGSVGGVRMRPRFLNPEAVTFDAPEVEETASVAAAAPTPPKPPTPEADSTAASSEKRPSVAELRKRVVDVAKNHTVIATTIVPEKGAIARRGELNNGKETTFLNGPSVFGDGLVSGADTARTKEELWQPGAEEALGISPEYLYIAPVVALEEIAPDDYEERIQQVTKPDGSKEMLFRIRYGFDPKRAQVAYHAAGNPDATEDNSLLIDTEIPASNVPDVLDIVTSGDASAIREVARDLYVQNVENGADLWDNKGGKPPYDQLPDNWNISVIIPEATDTPEDIHDNLIVSNRPVRR